MFFKPHYGRNSSLVHLTRIPGVVFIPTICLLLLGSVAFARPLTFDDFISLGRVSDPQVAPDGKTVAFVITYYDKEENKGNSDIYLADLKSGEVSKLTNSPEGDTQPRFSPDGKFIAFASSRSGASQIWLLPTFGGEARQLTDISTGASGPVWMPDGEHILFTSRVYPDCLDDSCNASRLDKKEKGKVKARIITTLLYRHWDHWIGDRRRHVFIASVEDGKTHDLTPGSLNVPTIALGSGHDYAISPDGKELSVVANTDPMPAVSTNNDIFTISLKKILSDIESKSSAPEFPGQWRRLTSNPANDNYPSYSPDGRFIAFRAMERPGFEADRYRLMLYDCAKQSITEVGFELAEKLDRSVRSITWSPNSKKIFVTCSDEGYVSVYAINIKNKHVDKLSEKMYISSLKLTPDGKNFVFLKQSTTKPYEVFVARKNFKNRKRIANLSRVNSTSLSDIDMNPLEEFIFEGAENMPVHGFLLKPPGFKAGKKYPLVFLIHGGPQGAWTDNWHWRWNYQMFASPGYVVVAINPRGSTGYGQKFTDEISQDWGGKVFEDLTRGLDFILDEYGEFIDEERIVAAGASFGGYMINWIEGHMESLSKPFKCLVNHDGVYNLTSMYGSTEELWFPEWDFGGTPWENPEGYEKFSPSLYAKNFNTPMLIIHGELDFRVPLAEAMQVFTALKRNGVPAKFLYFPDEGHWVRKPLNAELWWETVHHWIAEWIK